MMIEIRIGVAPNNLARSVNSVSLCALLKARPVASTRIWGVDSGNRVWAGGEALKAVINGVRGISPRRIEPNDHAGIVDAHGHGSPIFRASGRQWRVKDGDRAVGSAHKAVSGIN